MIRTVEFTRPRNANDSESNWESAVAVIKELAPLYAVEDVRWTPGFPDEDEGGWTYEAISVTYDTANPVVHDMIMGMVNGYAGLGWQVSVWRVDQTSGLKP
jgi:hypothetical protein